ncbi:MAG: hypothetical protein WBO68_12300 [Pyrinomonadaceae bacterium]
MKTRRSYLTLTIISTVLIAVVLGCGGAGSECVGTVTYQGKTFEGKAKTADEAKGNACNNYCRDADPEYDAMYRIWLDSPKGKSAGSPSKQEAIFKDEALMKFVSETCSKRCVATMSPDAKCK